MAEAITRQWWMLQRIPRAPRKISANALAEELAAAGYPVSRRTVERDLRTLSAVFPLISDERSRPFGWSWADGAATISIPAMTPQAALVLRMAREHLTRVLPGNTLETLAPQFEQARRALAHAPEGLASWPDKVRTVSRGQPLIPPAIATETLETVYAALQSGHQLAIRYRRRREPRVRDYVAHPLGVVLRDGMVTLVATLFHYRNPVQLHLHRVLQANALTEPARVPTDFDLDAWLARDPLGFRLGERLHLRMRMAVEPAKHLEETPLSRDQVIGPVENGWREITATVEDTAQLRWWLLGFGPRVEVLGPDALRGEIIGELKRAVATYG
ncbi:helix-turn-helix transcriptional regulator [Arhodomonas sp. KWT2]|uniref:helix-turn-helix transcriptional regulator n=1 Tax=unclassified Arhodomonas TaxID=2621637 RepID=UPI0013D0894C|nr:WYL domain-containing protein [Arhodomonas sp. KWT]